MEALKQAIRTYAEQHGDEDGLADTPVPGLRVMAAFGPGRPKRSVYRPLVCLVLQGAKHLAAGTVVREIAAGDAVFVAADLPVVGRVARASREEPYLALSIELDMAIMQEIALQVPARSPPSRRTGATVFSDDTDRAALDCAERLMRLIDRPDSVPILLPVILRELQYWLLSGRYGEEVRALALPDSHARQIARAVEILRAEYRQPILVDRLAAAAGMSASSFHRHFKAVTSLSPLQFQKHLRLVEARRLMLGEGISASNTAFEVGYESVAQFTREYRRMFGAPPKRDVRMVLRPEISDCRETDYRHS